MAYSLPLGRTKAARLLAIVGTALALGTVAAAAQDWPNRTVKVVVPYGPGGVRDVIVRIFADRLSKAHGQTFVIENRAGAGGMIGTEYAARAPGDGYTILCAGGAPFMIVPQMQKLAFDPVKDLAPVGLLTVNGMALVVTPDVPARTLGEFIDYVKQRPGQINYSVGGIGTLSYLSPAIPSARAGLNMVAVPDQSMPPAITALMSGTVQMFFGNISDIIEPIRSGKVRLLAVSTEKRSAEFPDVATVSESLPGFTVIGWNACFVPLATPQPIIHHLSKTIADISRDPEVIKKLANIGIDTVASTPDDVTKAIQTDVPLFKTALAAAGLLRKDAAK